MNVEPTTSPLIELVRAGERSADELRGRTHPLVEDAADGCLITFVHESAKTDIALYLAAAGNDLEMTRPMSRLEGTDLWTATYSAPRDLHTVYGFFEDAPKLELTMDGVTGEVEELSAKLAEVMACLVHDPSNPTVITLDAGEHTVQTSAVYGPDAVARSEPDAGVGRGALSEHVVASEHLDGSRRVWLYEPFGYDSSVEHNVVVVLDGQTFLGAPFGGFAAELDRLHAADRISPTVALFIDSRDVIARAGDLSFQPEFLRFVVDELLPLAAKRVSLADSAASRAIGGASLGGSTAAFFALQAPEVFGTGICLSPAVFLAYEGEPGAIIAAYAETATPPQRLHIAIGAMEEFMLPTTRAFAEVVEQRGIAMTYSEYSGAHDLVGWLPELERGVVAAFGR